MRLGILPMEMKTHLLMKPTISKRKLLRTLSIIRL